MSESNIMFPFLGVEGGDTLDIDAIFGNNFPGGDVNPFEMPMAQGPIEVVSAAPTTMAVPAAIAPFWTRSWTPDGGTSFTM